MVLILSNIRNACSSINVSWERSRGSTTKQELYHVNNTTTTHNNSKKTTTTATCSSSAATLKTTTLATTTATTTTTTTTTRTTTLTTTLRWNVAYCLRRILHRAFLTPPQSRLEVHSVMPTRSNRAHSVMLRGEKGHSYAMCGFNACRFVRVSAELSEYYQRSASSSN